MSWREKLGVSELQSDDRSDKTSTCVTSVAVSMYLQDNGDGLQSIDETEPEVELILADRGTSDGSRMIRHELPAAEAYVSEVRSEISRLLASAYCRYQGRQKSGPNRHNRPGEDSLANLATRSVHGVVP
jgi:hypothetical protein